MCDVLLQGEQHSLLLFLVAFTSINLHNSIHFLQLLGLFNPFPHSRGEQSLFLLLFDLHRSEDRWHLLFTQINLSRHAREKSAESDLLSLLESVLIGLAFEFVHLQRDEGILHRVFVTESRDANIVTTLAVALPRIDL